MTERPRVETVTLGGQRYVILPEQDYCRLTGEEPEPSLPAPDAQGFYPAVESMLVLMAQDIIRTRRRLGWSQRELARRAGIRPETLNRIERGKYSPSAATMEKLDRAFRRAHSAGS